MTLAEEFKKALNNEPFSEELFIPILNWLSGYRDNIEMCQRINKRLLSNINRKIFILEVSLSNTLHRFIRYPKSFKPDDKLDFFYTDLCKYLGWTKLELWKNSKVINMSYLTPVIARKYAYNNKERKLLSLEKIK
ncbi:MAG: hypothetical protein ACTSUT_13295, partial [Promethearchaeota archaeon]